MHTCGILLLPEVLLLVEVFLEGLLDDPRVEVELLLAGILQEEELKRKVLLIPFHNLAVCIDLTDSGAFMKTFALPIWNSPLSILTDFRMCSTPRLASPFQRGQVSSVSSAYLRSGQVMVLFRGAIK